MNSCKEVPLQGNKDSANAEFADAGESHYPPKDILSNAMLNANNIKYTLVNQMHMLRHFEGLSDALDASLLRAGYSAKGIQKELNEPGSRFFARFAQDIPSLLESIFKHPCKELPGDNGNLLLHGAADPIEFPNGIGTRAVLPVMAIPPTDRDRISIRRNRGIDLLHLEVDEIPSTAEFTLVLRPTNHGHVFITAFPGPPSMPLPHHRLKKPIYEQCKAYWQNHVFLYRAQQ